MPERKHSETLFVAVLAAALLALCIVLLTTACHNPHAPPARVEIQLGDDWQTLRARSTYAFRNWENYPNRYAINFETVTFVFAGITPPLEFNDTRGLYFEFDAGRVNEIRVTTFGANAPWEQMAQRVLVMVGDMERAGLRQREGKSVHEQLDKVRAHYDNPTFQNMLNQAALGVWRNDAVQVEIEFYRVHSRGEIAHGKLLLENEYALNVKFSRAD